MFLMTRFATAMVLVALAAGPVLAQAQAPTTSAPPPARTPSVLTGPRTGLPRVGPPASDPRLTVSPVPGAIDPQTGQPVDAQSGSTGPADPRTPSVLTPPSSR
jgi:hypothetical protein